MHILSLPKKYPSRDEEYSGGLPHNHHPISTKYTFPDKAEKEALTLFGERTEKYLKAWLQEYDPGSGNIWGLEKWGITSILAD